MNRRGWIIQTFNGAKSGAAFGAVFGALTGGITSKSCFVAGTEILTVAGLVAIENISEGDEVLAENPETGEKGVKRVVQTFVKQTYNLVHIYVEDEEIVTTPEHPFWEMNREWCSAIEIRAGDILKLANGKTAIVSKVYSETLSSPVTVYNFEVEDYHTYYVGEDSVLVHNWCDPKKIYKSIKDAPNYNRNFVKVQNGIKKVNINNKGLLQELNKIGSGWKKVYQNGWINGQKVSLHYFQDASGKIFDFKIKYGKWS